MRALPMLLLVAAVADCNAVLAQPLPGLHFEPPAGFSGVPSGDPAVYATPAKDATLHIYPFRRFHGSDPAAEFRDSLLREHLPRQYREPKPAAAPPVEAISITDADAAYIARFKVADTQRLRLMIVAPGHIALLDVQATSAAALERHWPALQAMLASMRVTRG
jgi:hypothetical protein